MKKKNLIDIARAANDPKDALLDEAHRIIQAVMDGRIDIASIKHYLESEEAIRQMPMRDFFETLDQIRERRSQWGIPREE
jgi:hypothetical protein